MTFQLFHFATLTILVFLGWSCSPKKFSSQASHIQLSAFQESKTDLSKILNQAMLELENAQLADENVLAKTSWKLAGYHEMRYTTDGKGQIISLFPNGHLNLTFGEIAEDACLVGFYCAAVVRKHLISVLETSCGNQTFKSFHSQNLNNAGLVQSNIQISSQSSETLPNNCNSENDRLLLEKLNWLNGNGQVLIKSLNQFLFVQILSSTFVFVK